MSPEQQKLALLEWAGWRLKPFVEKGPLCWHSPDGEPKSWEGDQCKVLPNLDSLDVLATFEEKLTPHQRRNYPQEIALVCGIGEGEEWTSDEDWTIIHASAPQRLEALVRTLGLWRES